MKNNNRSYWILALVGGLSLGLTQCTSVKNQSLGPKTEFSNEPFVEAYLEFPGPRRLWAGPQTVILHVTAKDGENPTLLVTPAYFQSAAAATEPEKVNLVKRTLSSAGDTLPAEALPTQVLKVGSKMKMPVAAVRDELSDIIDSFEDTPAGQEVSSGCAFPLRLKLIRTNGAVVEKWGCRGGAAWTKTASEAASRFLASASFLEIQTPAVNVHDTDTDEADSNVVEKSKSGAADHHGH